MTTHTTHFYLCNILRNHGLKQTELALFVQGETGMHINPSSFNKYILGHRSTKKYEDNLANMTAAIQLFLSNKKVPQKESEKIWDKGQPYGDTGVQQMSREALKKREQRARQKLLKEEQLKQQQIIQPEPEMLSSKALAHFKLHKDPFINEITSGADLFLHEQQRLAREKMLHAVKNSTMLALIAESGAGKTQVRKSFYQVVSNSDDKIRIIEPEVIDKSEMTPAMIIAAIADALDIEHIPHSKEKAARHIKKHMQRLAANGYKFGLVIEEAHDLPDRVLKYLKRIWEWDDGFRKLMGVILIGQNELKGKLAETQLQVREFARRCHQVELYPLADSMGSYLAHKFERAGASIDNVITPDAIAYLHSKLKRETDWGNHRPSQIKDHSYPLTVNAWVSHAMNRCVELGEPVVSPAIIDKVKEGF